jgi:hypothetical protein
MECVKWLLTGIRVSQRGLCCCELGKRDVSLESESAWTLGARRARRFLPWSGELFLESDLDDWKACFVLQRGRKGLSLYV